MSNEMTITLTSQALQSVRDLAAAQGLTVAEVLRQAISHEQWLADEKKSGSASSRRTAPPSSAVNSSADDGD